MIATLAYVCVVAIFLALIAGVGFVVVAAIWYLVLHLWRSRG